MRNARLCAMFRSFELVEKQQLRGVLSRACSRRFYDPETPGDDLPPTKSNRPSILSSYVIIRGDSRIYTPRGESITRRFCASFGLIRPRGSKGRTREGREGPVYTTEMRGGAASGRFTTRGNVVTVRERGRADDL